MVALKRILIANRGEIACRIIHTARRLGIGTVAVYSGADATGKHVALADSAMHIGPAPVSESYLVGERLIEAAMQSGCDAVHPGYGFLSENPEFVEAVEIAGLRFIGPPASAIRAMGLKDAAKALMVEAGVPVVPGYHGAEQAAEFLAARANDIGYPVLIKARAGGGGKGMRRVARAADLETALMAAQREAQASFGDPVCLVEKWIDHPRHIEFQVFADAHGQVVHLFERDCSLQRRHQKVIEEAPAPGMSESVRAAMGQAAVEAARAIGYVGAGTVEFIADSRDGLREDGFWFMEMNTRLQVEHPVTEAITGLDLVEWQLRVAAGENLGFTQDTLSIQGWAFEARLYAEDVAAGFLPATGTLEHLVFPADAVAFERAPVRVDSGVRAGDTVTPWYDPMIAKLVVHGRDRNAALAALTRALAQCQVAALVTNLDFLLALSRHTGFRQGRFDTGLIERDLEALVEVPAVSAELRALAALRAMSLLEQHKPGNPWHDLAGYRHWSNGCQSIDLLHGETSWRFEIVIQAPDVFQVQGPGVGVQMTVTPSGNDRYRIETPGQVTEATAVRSANRVSVFSAGAALHLDIPDPLIAFDEVAQSDTRLLSPMPGRVVRVVVRVDEEVKQGQILLVLEAMKMEHTLVAPRDTRVVELLVSEQQQVSQGDVLLSFAEAAQPEQS